VKSISVGAFQYEHIGPFGTGRRKEDRRASRAQVTTEDEAFVSVVELDIGRSQDMPSRRISKGCAAWQVLPFAVRDRVNESLDFFEDLSDEAFVLRDAKSNGVFQHDRKKPGRGRSAIDWLVESRFDQVRDPSNVIDMNVRQDEALYAIERKLDFVALESTSISSLEHSAVHEDRIRVAIMKLVT
jgi:hypothetical protein